MIFPNPVAIDPVVSAPTDVNEDVMTAEPSVVLLRTDDPLI